MKVTVKAGVTLHISRPDINEFVKLEVEVGEVDTELDLDDQMAIAKEYMDRTYLVVGQKLEERIKQELGRDVRVT